MKKILFLTAALIVAQLIVSGAAFARVQNFTHFSIDVASGWTASEDEDSNVLIHSPDRSSVLQITVTPRESPRKLDDVATLKQGFIEEGVAMSQPKQADDDVYVMNGMKNGVPIVVVIAFEGDWAFILVNINPQEKYESVVERMINSIEEH